VAARGYYGTPGIYTDDQVVGWKKIVDAVHAKGCKIFLQLWHVGRVSHVEMTGGETPVGPSIITTEAVAFTTAGWVPVSPNRALRTDEIPGILEAYRAGSERAMKAGFDGVEIHCGNGYLLDQFLQDGTNKRTDAYGGSVENRARLLLEAVDGVVGLWGPERVGVRVSPSSKFHDMFDSNPASTFGYVASELKRRKIAYMHVIEPRIKGNVEIQDGLPSVASDQIKENFGGTVIAAGGFDAKGAEEILERGGADLVAFGRFFIANPDLPERFRLGIPLNPYDRSTFYGGNAKGYIDYPFAESVPAVTADANSILTSRMFTPFMLGTIPLQHRVVMAPLTRLRSEQPGDVPGDLMAHYYEQRTSQGGLIITESAEITPEASAYEGAPGIYTGAQVNGWRKVTEVIHRKGGFVFLQLWHSGRVSHPDLTGVIPVSASATESSDILIYTNKGPVPAPPCRALEVHELPGIVHLYRLAAMKARSAGFDGVEILAAGGYLLDQFLQNGTNLRTDAYGGSVDNRSRLLLEVVEAVTEVFTPNRIGVRLSPSGIFNGISDSAPELIFDYVAGALNRFGLAYLHVIEPRVKGGQTLHDGHPPIAAARLRKIFKGPMIAAGGFDRVGALEVLNKGEVDLVAFGRHFIANPDLPERLRLGIPLHPYNRSTFYSPGPEGYIDYPFHAASSQTLERLENE
jgi:N-ethylmaleimide reductase